MAFHSHSSSSGSLPFFQPFKLVLERRSGEMPFAATGLHILRKVGFESKGLAASLVGHATCF